MLRTSAPLLHSHKADVTLFYGISVPVVTIDERPFFEAFCGFDSFNTGSGECNFNYASIAICYWADKEASDHEMVEESEAP